MARYIVYDQASSQTFEAGLFGLFEAARSPSAPSDLQLVADLPWFYHGLS
jgi:hypothetical protein